MPRTRWIPSPASAAFTAPSPAKAGPSMPRSLAVAAPSAWPASCGRSPACRATSPPSAPTLASTRAFCPHPARPASRGPHHNCPPPAGRPPPPGPPHRTGPDRGRPLRPPLPTTAPPASCPMPPMPPALLAAMDLIAATLTPITLRPADPDDPAAQTCLAAYFALLSDRVPEVSPTHFPLPDPQAHTYRPPHGAFLLALVRHSPRRLRLTAPPWPRPWRGQAPVGRPASPGPRPRPPPDDRDRGSGPRPRHDPAEPRHQRRPDRGHRPLPRHRLVRDPALFRLPLDALVLAAALTGGDFSQKNRGPLRSADPGSSPLPCRRRLREIDGKDAAPDQGRPFGRGFPGPLRTVWR